MRINCRLLAVVIIFSIICCHVTAEPKDSEDTKNHDGNDRGVNPNDAAKKGKAGESVTTDPNVLVEPKGGDREQKNGKDNDQKDEKENKGLDAKSKGETEEDRFRPPSEKCDSSSNSCTADDNMLVACLRVPGNDSPALSLLIQNKGKGSRTITISAPNLVKLDKGNIKLQENKDDEVKVTIDGLESGDTIELSAGQGVCRLNFSEQYLALKKADHIPKDPHSSIFNRTLSTGFLILGVAIVAAASFFIYTRFGSRYFTGKGPKYQKLDAELPVSHGSKLEAGGIEGWDDSWGDNWDDEEAPLTPSMPITPSLSSKGIASRKFNKDAWND
ncbi:uncharacterized protein LOC127255961 [Andrographis paniculata]|uniref:uncharacterized protein LOC127255961 n=1 Tax=Andrographis paniculata TaxID=175694 RepID=UPI0021E7FDAF|nr:uncharacterized protein LOC127255961 [Andrographis paniculata]